MPLDDYTREKLIHYYPNEKIFNSKEEFLDYLSSIASDSKDIRSKLANTLLSYRKFILTNRERNIECANQQQHLWNVIQETIRNFYGDEFNDNWLLLSMFFYYLRDNDDVASETSIFRYIPWWDNENEEIDSFTRIINLLRVLCNPTLRKLNFKQVHLDRTFNTRFFDEQSKQKVIQFYNR